MNSAKAFLRGKGCLCFLCSFIARRALEELEISGQRIKKDQGVVLMLASGNRDAKRFANLNGMSLSREKNFHLSFGKGEYACITRALVTQTIANFLEVMLNKLSIGKLLSLSKNGGKGHCWLETLPISYKLK